MGHAHAVAVGQGFEKALDEDGRLGLGDWAVNDAVEECVGLAEVHDDGEIIVVLEDIEDLKDVWVRREKSHEFWFVLETLAVGGIGEERLVDDLAGVGFVGERVETPEDGSESSTTDLLVYLVLRLQRFAHSSFFRFFFFSFVLCCGVCLVTLFL